MRDRLAPHVRSVLEAAAVRGTEFTTAELASCIEMSEDDVESHCEKLAQDQRWIRASGIVEWPDTSFSSG